MRQALHILRKDLRHHWPEIVVSLALLAAFCRYEVRSWRFIGVTYAVAGGYFLDDSLLPGLTKLLLPVAWAVLVIRVIQNESLVGDRQFWVTRPYEWKPLLAAKFLFILVCLNLPMFVADIYLLARAGFPPLSYIAGLLWMQLLILLILVLAAATLAAVTATVFQTVLAFILIVLYGIVASAIDAAVPNSNSHLTSGFDTLQLSLVVATALAVVLLQYSRRGTTLSRLLLAGLGVALALISVATPYRWLIDREFPPLAVGEQPPAQVALIPQEPSPNPPELPPQEKLVGIAFPVAVSGLREEDLVQLNGVKVTIDLPDGTRWSSVWSSLRETLRPEKKKATLGFNVSKSFYDRWRNEQVNVHLTYAASVYRDGARRDLLVPGGEFFLPDIGYCTADRGIRCRAALKRPWYLVVRTRPAESTCKPYPGQPTPPPGTIAWADLQWETSGPAEPGISPIVDVAVYSFESSTADHAPSGGICPGTPITLSHPTFDRHFQHNLDFNSVRLADYNWAAIFGSGR